MPFSFRQTPKSNIICLLASGMPSIPPSDWHGFLLTNGWHLSIRTNCRSQPTKNSVISIPQRCFQSRLLRHLDHAVYPIETLRLIMNYRRMQPLIRGIQWWKKLSYSTAYGSIPSHFLYKGGHEVAAQQKPAGNNSSGAAKASRK